MSSDMLLLSGSMAIAAGLVGAFALMRRMTLAADALSHVALPGISLAILFRVHPLAGALAALVAGVILIWMFERRARLATETMIGVVFSAALAVGALLSTGEELMEALFGAPGTLSAWEVVTGVAGASAVVVFVLLARHRLILMLVSPDLARTAGVDVRRMDLLYLLAFALVVAMGLRFLGVLLMGSLVIIPAATARQVARNLISMLIVSSALSLLATLVGAAVAAELQRATGPVTVVVAAACFFVVLAIPRRLLARTTPSLSTDRRELQA